MPNADNAAKLSHKASARQQELVQHPLSYAQERLWFLDQLEPGSSTYNTARAFRLFGTLDKQALEAALTAIAARHDIIRTTYHAPDGIPRQVVGPQVPVELTKVDLASVADDEREDALQSHIREAFAHPFDLTSDLMLRAMLFRLTPETHVLLLVMHHIATDGWSMNILLRELATFYNAFTQGQEPSLSSLPLRYADYAARQRAHPDGEVADREFAYWRQQLAGAPAQLAVPLDRTRDLTPSYDGERLSTSIPMLLAEEVRDLARRHGATPFMTLLAIFFVVIHRYTSQDDLCVGVPIAGRTDLDAESLVGVFVNMLVIREQLSGALPFIDFLRDVRNTCLDAYDHQSLPFERLVALLQPQRIRNRTPLFQVSFSLQPQPTSTVPLHGLRVECADVEANSAKFDLSVVLHESKRGFVVNLTYPKRLFDRCTIQRILDHFVHACRDVCAHPGQRLDEIQLAPRPASQSTLGTREPHSQEISGAASIPEAFALAATKYSDAVALQMGAESMTYGELDRASDELAAHVLTFGVPRGARIGVYLEPSLERIISYLAILKSGASYVPLDPSSPTQRTAQLIAEAELHTILTTTQLLQDVPAHHSPHVCVDVLARSDQGSQDAIPSFPRTGPEDLAYVIFTSGSTGQPKGVMIPHRGVLRLVTDPDYVALNQDTRLLHLASPTFDASTFEIWGPLLNGGVCVLSPARVPSISELSNLIRKNAINTLWLTSSWFNAIVDEAATILAPVRQLLVGGERLSVPHVTRALQALPNTQLVNGYGPTENTTFSCCYNIPRTLDPNAGSVPIGRPIQGDFAIILDTRQQPTAPGVPGELCVGGRGLALGYLNDAALTTERFILDPLQPTSRRLVYRTGDRVRLLPSGDLEFLGRMDRQLKIRGFRVEPGEIEHVMMQHPTVAQVYLTRRKSGNPMSSELVAYVRAEGDHAISTADLRQFLSTRLPDYMIPSYCISVSSFPRNASGKIDEDSLPDPTETNDRTPGSFVHPETDMQKRLAVLWQAVLDRDRIGIDDNFFEIGGHSLLAVRLVAQLEAALGISLPLAILFDAPTIATLATRVETLDPSTQRSTVLPIRGAQHALPFVCVPPGGSSVYHFSNLARYLPPEVSVYGTQPLGVEYAEAPQQSVEEMASRYIADLRQIQPDGPYYLGGRCFGAFVAFEMAQQLVRQGSEIGLLVLMDPSAPPGLSRDAKYYAGRVSYFRRRGQLGHAVLRHLNARIRQVRRLWLRRVLADAQERRMARMQRVHRHAQFTYKPTPYPGDVIFLGAQEDYDPEDPRALWQLLVEGEFTLHLVPGDHRTMTQEPHIRTFAYELGQLVIAAQRAHQSGGSQAS